MKTPITTKVSSIRAAHPTQGFTLIELLVGMAIGVLLLFFLMTSFSATSKNTVQVNARSDLQQELLNAQQLIAGRVREAWYVYPAGKTFDLGSGVLRSNPLWNGTSGTTGVWTTGTQPILAMILPPKQPGGPCTTAPNNAGCYRFFAYYPVNRASWLGGTSSGTFRVNNPGADSLNDASAWVLAEYRSYYYGSTAPPPFDLVYSTPSIPPVAGSDANLLADYLQPTTTAPTYTMFSFISPNPLVPIVNGAPDGPWVDDNANGLADQSYVSGVSISLVTRKDLGSSVLRLPGTGSYTITAAPRNLGKTF